MQKYSVQVDNIYKDLSQIAAAKEIFECCIHKRIETSQLIKIAGI